MCVCVRGYVACRTHIFGQLLDKMSVYIYIILILIWIDACDYVRVCVSMVSSLGLGMGNGLCFNAYDHIWVYASYATTKTNTKDLTKHPNCIKIMKHRGKIQFIVVVASVLLLLFQFRYFNFGFLCLFLFIFLLKIYQ